MKLEISAEEQKMLLSCIDSVVRAGGVNVAASVLPLYYKVQALQEAEEPKKSKK